MSGDTAMVGARYDDTEAGFDTGSVYVFVRSSGTWTEGPRLTASDASPYDDFGSVALSGDTAVVGAYLDDTPAGENAASAYVFHRSGGVWTERAHLFAPDGSTYDFFGGSVALDGDTAVVGAPWHNAAWSPHVFPERANTYADPVRSDSRHPTVARMTSSVPAWPWTGTPPW